MNRQHHRARHQERPPGHNNAATGPNLFAEAVQHHRAGRFSKAEQLYHSVLSESPRHADSLNLLGVIAHQAGRHDLAADFAHQALAINGGAASYHLSLGNAFKGQGRREEALACFRKAVQLQPGLLEAVNNLGIALGEIGKFEDAISCFRRVIKKNPSVPEFHNNLGNILVKQGSIEKAIDCFRQAIILNPRYCDAHKNLAIALRNVGDIAGSVAAFRRILDLESEYPGAHDSLGILLRSQGMMDDAVDCFLTAIKLNPSSPDAHSRLGIIYSELERLDKAALCFRTAIVLRPDSFVAHNNLGQVLQELGEAEEALSCFRKAIELNPDVPELYNNLGTLLGELGHLDEAAAYLRQALGLKADYPEAISNLGMIIMDQGPLDEAARYFHRAIALAPDFAKAHNNLGIAFRRQGRLNEAVAAYRTALECQASFAGRPTALDEVVPPSARPAARFKATVEFNLAMALLARGDMAEGWKRYESRWKTRQFAKARPRLDRPQWRGEPAAGRTLLIHGEQGFGDTLQFCRYATMAAALGLRVTLEVQKPLVRLLRSLPNIDCIAAHGDGLPEFDLYCPMLSMPLACATTTETIPSAPSYLYADKEHVAAWRERLAPPSGFRVGLVWAGNSRRHSPGLAIIDQRRSLPPERLAPLFTIPGLQFFSLQKDGPAMPADFPLTDFMGAMVDFADTAALIENLDLVISVDTAVAHMASALGKEVWVMDRHDPCWRWFTGRRDSPWYPALRLYRQPCPGDWDSVLQAVMADLRGLAKV